MKEKSCPHCKRLLVYVDDEGGLTICGQTSLNFLFPADAVEGGEQVDGKPDISSALCHRWLCSLKRWWYSE